MVFFNAAACFFVFCLFFFLFAIYSVRFIVYLGVKATETADTSSERDKIMIPVENAHFVQIKYLGPTNYRPSRYSISWEGWPSEGSNTVRRNMSYVSDRAEMANNAAAAFVEWLTDGNTGLAYTVQHITLAQMPGPSYACLIKTKAEPKGAAA